MLPVINKPANGVLGNTRNAIDPRNKSIAAIRLNPANSKAKAIKHTVPEKMNP